MSFLGKIAGVFGRQGEKVGEEDLANLQKLMIDADFSYAFTERVCQKLKRSGAGKDRALASVSDFIVKSLEGAEFKGLLRPSEAKGSAPKVLFFCGVNGSGKTTTVAKLANLLLKRNSKVMLAACDVFRAAAVEQLAFWADQISANIEKPQHQNDKPSTIAYRAIQRATEEQCDYVVIDTSGRLQTNSDLMDELQKTYSICKKANPKIEIEVILTVDTTVGQNGASQIENFRKYVPIESIILTKLDGGARGGAVISFIEPLLIKIPFICNGEKLDDIEEFNAKKFAKLVLDK